MAGDDLVPDIAVGRLAVQTAAEAANIVAKIKQYEANLTTTEEWRRNLLFVSDGEQKFHTANQTINRYIEDQTSLFSPHFLQLHQNVPDALSLRTAMFDLINGDESDAALGGVSIVNFRGHGSPTVWGEAEVILKADQRGLWQNWGRPVVILSADFHDGNFALPGTTALSE